LKFSRTTSADLIADSVGGFPGLMPLIQKVMLKNSKDLYISSFYMPHRNINDINKLSESITMVNNGKPNHIILAGL
jgi:hypothetical protein